MLPARPSASWWRRVQHLHFRSPISWRSLQSATRTCSTNCNSSSKPNGASFVPPTGTRRLQIRNRQRGTKPDVCPPRRRGFLCGIRDGVFHLVASRLFHLAQGIPLFATTHFPSRRERPFRSPLVSIHHRRGHYGGFYGSIVPVARATRDRRTGRSGSSGTRPVRRCSGFVRNRECDCLDAPRVSHHFDLECELGARFGAS